MTRSRRLPRGQTMVLFALTGLLLALLVMMTLGIATRIHEREELQAAADAAAYSEAVTEARTLNGMAVYNRAIVAQMSSIAAGQAVLSWLGYYHGALNNGRDLLADMANSGCVSPELDAARMRIEAEDRRLIDLWEDPAGGYGGILGLDVKAAEFIRTDLYFTATQMGVDQRRLYTKMLTRVGDASRRIAGNLRQSSPWGANDAELESGSAKKTRDELDDAIDEKQQKPIDAMQLFMATRGIDPFISARAPNRKTGQKSGGTFVQERLQAVIEPTSLVVTITDFGTAYYNDEGPNFFRNPGGAEDTGYDGQMVLKPWWRKWKNLHTGKDDLKEVVGAWGQDYGVFTFDWTSPPPGCDGRQDDTFGYLVVTGKGDTNDNHMWRRGNPGYGDYRERGDVGHVSPSYWPEPRHGIQIDNPDAFGVSIWPVFVDFRGNRADPNQTPDAPVNAFNQPKTVVVMRRQFGHRAGPNQPADPWELNFKFAFDSSSGPTEIDLRANRKLGANPPNASDAFAAAAGLVYYHRGAPQGADDHSREPPNLFNPFWRATLVASDVDESFTDRGNAAIDMMQLSGAPRAAQTLNALKAEGYEAMP